MDSYLEFLDGTTDRPTMEIRQITLRIPDSENEKRDVLCNGKRRLRHAVLNGYCFLNSS